MMLILTRRVGETLIIGKNIKIMALGIKGNQVRIGIEAPKDVVVDREEIWLRKNPQTDIALDDPKYSVGQNVFFSKGENCIMNSTIEKMKVDLVEGVIVVQYLLKCNRPNTWIYEKDIFESADALFQYLRKNSWDKK